MLTETEALWGVFLWLTTRGMYGISGFKVLQDKAFAITLCQWRLLRDQLRLSRDWVDIIWIGYLIYSERSSRTFIIYVISRCSFLFFLVSTMLICSEVPNRTVDRYKAIVTRLQKYCAGFVNWTVSSWIFSVLFGAKQRCFYQRCQEDLVVSQQ